MSRRLAVFLGLALLAVTSGCSSQSTIKADPKASSYGNITIASGVSDETKLVAALYAEALSRAGYSSQIVDTGTSRSDLLTQLTQGESQASASASATASNNPDTLDIAPDYSGELLMYLTQDGAFSVSYLEQAAASASVTASPTPTPSPKSTTSASPSPVDTSLNVASLNSNDIRSSLSKLLPSSIGILDSSNANPKHVLTVTSLFGTQNGVTSLNDLGRYCSVLTFDMTADYSSKGYLAKALEKSYQCRPQTVLQDADQATRSQKLLADQVQVADLRSTSPVIADNRLTVLSDPSHLLLDQQIIPLIRSSEVPESARDAINTVSENLTDAQLTKLLRLTSGSDAISNQEAAKFWFDHLQG